MIGTLMMGFLIGMGHALEPDHLAAVASLTVEEQSRRKAMLQGVLWGLGHTVVLLLFGGAILVLDRAIPDSFSRIAEILVGVLLIALGLDVATRALQDRIQTHTHFRALAVGMVHGLAGSAALVLLALSMDSGWQAGLFYILFFGLGSILGMAILSLAIGWPMMQARMRRAGRSFRFAIGLVTVVIGIAMIAVRLI